MNDETPIKKALAQAARALNCAVGLAACTAARERDPITYGAWLESRAPQPPAPDKDAIEMIAMLAHDLKNAVRYVTHNMKTGQPKPDRQEDAACDAWAQTAADLYYITTVMQSDQPAHREACAELINDEEIRAEIDRIADLVQMRVIDLMQLLPDDMKQELH